MPSNPLCRLTAPRTRIATCPAAYAHEALRTLRPILRALHSEARSMRDQKRQFSATIERTSATAPRAAQATHPSVSRGGSGCGSSTFEDCFKPVCKRGATCALIGAATAAHSKGRAGARSGGEGGRQPAHQGARRPWGRWMSWMMGIKRLPSVTRLDHQRPISERSFHCSLNSAFTCGRVGSVGLKAGGDRNTLGEGLGEGVIARPGKRRCTLRHGAGRCAWKGGRRRSASLSPEACSSEVGWSETCKKC